MQSSEGRPTEVRIRTYFKIRSYFGQKSLESYWALPAADRAYVKRDTSAEVKELVLGLGLTYIWILHIFEFHTYFTVTAVIERVNFYRKIFYNSELRFGKQKVIMSAVIVSFDLI